MKAVFFGTPAFSARVLQYLLENNINIMAVVTRPPKPRLRSATPVPSPTEELAKERHIPVLTPVKASDPSFGHDLIAYGADLFVVVAYGQILPRHILEIPPLGSFNLHASLLPKYRGASPIVRALMNGETETGVTIMAMNPAMDAGDMVGRVVIPIGPEMNFGELENALCEAGQQALIETLHRLEKGLLVRHPQDSSQATLAPKLKAADLVIDWTRPAQKIHDQIRALSPHPGAWCPVILEGRQVRLKILRSRVVNLLGTPGQTLLRSVHDLVVSAGDGALELLAVQLEGRRPSPIAEFLRGLGPRSLEFIPSPVTTS